MRRLGIFTFMNHIYFILILCLASSCRKVSADLDPNSEAYFKMEIQKQLGGKLEYTVKNGRIDLLTDEVAYEVTWAEDWKDAIGRSLWYGMQTHRDAGIILLMRERSDLKYKKQLETTIEYMKGNKAIVIKAYPDDFKVDQ